MLNEVYVNNEKTHLRRDYQWVDFPRGWQLGIDNSEYPLVFYASRHNGVTVRHCLFNASEEKLGILKIRETNEPPHLMGPQQGLQWSYHSQLVDDFSDDSAPSKSAPLRARLQELAARPDIPNTGSPGNPSTTMNQPEFMEMRRYFGDDITPSEALTWLDKYLDYQLLRSRWRFDPSGGITGADGSLPRPIPWYDPNDPNDHGVNGYDSGHLAAGPFFEGYMRIGDPMFLVGLVSLWCHARTHDWYFRHPEKVTSARMHGWIFVLANYILKATEGMDLFKGLRKSVVEEVTDHLAQAEKRYPIIDPYAKPHHFLDDERKKRVLYSHTWHWAVVLFGLKKLIPKLRDMSYLALADRADDLALDLRERINEDWFREDPEGGEYRIAAKIDEDGKVLDWISPHGVGEWFLPAMELFGGDDPIVKWLLEWQEEWGFTNPKHKYYFFHNGMAPLSRGQRAVD